MVATERAIKSWVAYENELHEGKHDPIITKSLFDRCQEVMRNKSKPKTDCRKPYLYRGMFRCGECGRLITTETQKGHNYLRCSKWEVQCSQRYAREDRIAMQLTEAVRSVALPTDWADEMLAEADVEAKKEVQAVNGRTERLRESIGLVEEQLDRLMDGYIKKDFNLDEYRPVKNKLMNEKSGLNEKLTSLEENCSSAFEPLKDFLNASKQARILAEAGTEEQKRDFFKKVASNPNVFNRELRWEPRGAWKLVAGQGSFAQHNAASSSRDAAFFGETRDVTDKRRGRDSNPRGGLSRLQHFQCCSFSRSDTSPEGQKMTGLVAGVKFDARGLNGARHSVLF